MICELLFPLTVDDAPEHLRLISTTDMENARCGNKVLKRDVSGETEHKDPQVKQKLRCKLPRHASVAGAAECNTHRLVILSCDMLKAACIKPN